jgi:hypothetical protein
MKPYFLMLLIAAIVVFSDLVRQGNASKRKRRRVPFIAGAVRRIGRTRAERREP